MKRGAGKARFFLADIVSIMWSGQVRSEGVSVTQKGKNKDYLVETKGIKLANLIFML